MLAIICFATWINFMGSAVPNEPKILPEVLLISLTDGYLHVVE
jgi:hypothetical protein